MILRYFLFTLILSPTYCSYVSISYEKDFDIVARIRNITSYELSTITNKVPYRTVSFEGEREFKKSRTQSQLKSFILYFIIIKGECICMME